MPEFVDRKLGDLTVRIDRLTCIASRNCIKLAPEVFELDDEHVVTFREGAPGIERDRLVEACSICPVDALVVIDEDGRQIVPRGENGGVRESL